MQTEGKNGTKSSDTSARTGACKLHSFHVHYTNLACVTIAMQAQHHEPGAFHCEYRLKITICAATVSVNGHHGMQNAEKPCRNIRLAHLHSMLLQNQDT